MAWSTRELAELTGTTVNTIRHYHRVGLLEEPDRRYNGYKQYRVRHLISLARTRRLVELGIPLARITDIDVTCPDASRELDAELRAAIEHLMRVRDDVAAVAREHAPLDTPRGFEAVARGLSAPDRAFLQVYARLAARDVLPDLLPMISAESAPLRLAFGVLPGNANEVARQRIADRIAASDANWRAVDGSEAVGHALAEARRELYNPAQQEVIARATSLRARQLSRCQFEIDEVGRGDLVDARARA
ncbi:MerR family transcriptional regulator [Nocardia sp. NPDC060249]|uniref:MerR family transcriptional regulator n=1 Tax=Nocardia sp. NPDC060249 TaxID=3347082 RepID=UPI003656058A